MQSRQHPHLRLASLIALLCCLGPQAVRCAPTNVGAGSYEVYVGSAFYTHELADSAAWSYVASNSDGLYWHPVGYNQNPTYKNATPAEWKRIASFFASKNVVVEGDMLDGKPTGDLGAIKLVRGLGLEPKVALVNRIKDSADSWQKRVDTNLSVGLESYTMIAPHRMETAPKGFFDTAYDHARDMILAGYGTSVDAPTYLYIHHSAKYRQSIFDAIGWVHRNKRKFCYLISPNVSADSFLAHAQLLTRELEDSGVVPDQFGVELYGLRPYTLTPETVTGIGGKAVSANTITGVAHWLLKHARADGQELDLWVAGPDGKAVGKGSVVEDLAKVAAIGFKDWKGINGSFAFTVNVRNASDWLDFAPALRARLGGLPAGWSARFEMGGQDVSKAILSTGIVFHRKDRLWPGDAKTLKVTLAKSGAATLPEALQIDFELAPHTGSHFVRDVARLSRDATTSSLETPADAAPVLRVRQVGRRVSLSGLVANGRIEWRDGEGRIVDRQFLTGASEVDLEVPSSLHGLHLLWVEGQGSRVVRKVVLP